MAGSEQGHTTSLHVPGSCGHTQDGWSWSRLDQICTGVFDCPHSTPRLTLVGPFVVRTQDIITGVFRVDLAGRVSEDTYAERVSRAIPSHGDILYSREGTYFGIAAEVPENTHVCLGQRMVLIRPDKQRLDFRYLRYWLNSPYMAAHIHGYRDGSVAERLNLPTIRSLPILVPPLAQQHAIAHILGTLDDKIELNRRTNETLEAMARAIFKSWFVDFDPVRAKAAGRKPVGLAPHIADLFPCAFEDSELGEIPKCWKASGLNTIALLQKTTVLPAKEPRRLWEHYSVPAFDEWQAPALDWGDDIKSGKYAVPSASVLVSKLNPQFPRVWLPDVRDESVAVCSTEFLPFVPIRPNWRPFLYELMRSDTVQQGIQARVTGSTGSRQRAKPDDVAAMQIISPGSAMIERFGVLVGPVHHRMLASIQESRVLSQVRDTLLPRLISGELRVPDAERIVGRCI